MKKITILLLVCLCAQYCQAQFEKKDNTFGGFGFGLLSPQGYYSKNVNSGFQISGEINGKIYQPIWFYFEGAYENLPVNNAILTDVSGSISTLGAGAGIKVLPVKFLYVSAGGGLRGVVSGTLPNSDKTTVFVNFGAGIYPLRFLGVFVDYIMWQTQNNYPSKNYLVAGVKLSFGHR